MPFPVRDVTSSSKDARAATTLDEGESARALHVTLIVGLPGSGKSTLAQCLYTACPGSFICDDPGSHEELIDACRRHAHVFVSHPHFCHPGACDDVALMLRRAFLEVALTWVFFENDPAACLLNAASRPGRIVDGLIRLLSRTYVIPEGFEVMKVYAPTAARPIFP